MGPFGPHLTLDLPNPNKQEQATPKKQKTYSTHLQTTKPLKRQNAKT